MVFVLGLSACGSVKGTSTDGGNGSGDAPGVDDFSLSVDMGSLTIPIAGSADVTVTVERNGAVGDITLSASGLGTNLDAAFAPTVIPAGETTSTVTISVKGGTQPGTSTVTLTGTAGDKTHSADVSVTTTTITVTGTVRGGRAGVKVGIIGKQSVTSGAGGVFTFTDVTPPYDLYTFNDSGCGNSHQPTVYYFDDLTRADPVVTAATYTPTCTFVTLCLFPGPSATVSGTKSGTGNNTDTVAWGWSAGSMGSVTLNSNGTFSGAASWCSGSTSTGSIYALQFTQKPNGAPNAFLGYAKTGSMTLTNGSPTTGVNVSFTSVNSTGTVTGTLTGPTGYPTPSVHLYQQFGTSSKSLWDANTTAIDAVFPMIASAGGNSLYASSTQSGVGTSYFVQPLTGNTTIDFTMPTPAVLSMPADAATGVTTTTMFQWTPSADVVSQVNISGTGAAYRIYTVNDHLTIPVIPELALPSATSFNWSITAYAPISSINDAAAASELESVTAVDYTGSAHATAISTGRSFTTQ